MALSHDPLWPRAGDWPAPAEGERWDAVAARRPCLADLALTDRCRRDTPPRPRRAAPVQPDAHGPPPIDLAEALRIADAGDVAEPDGPRGERARARVVTLSAASDLVVALGGDNSITYAVAQGADAAGLITLDAHFDLRDGVSNGSPVRRLVEDGLDPRASCRSASPTSPTRPRTRGAPPTSASASSRSTTSGAAASTTWSPKRWRSREAPPRRCGGIHLDIDVDVCDRAVAPGCPASVPGGLQGSCARSCVLAADARVRSADIVEVDATADAADGRTVRLAALCVLDLLAGVHDRRSTHDHARPRPTRQERLGQPALDDHDRPLNARPARCSRLARRLAVSGVRPGCRALLDGAARADHRAFFGEALGLEPELDPELYGAPAGLLLAAAAARRRPRAVVAHDPGMTVLADGSPAAHRPYADAPWRRAPWAATSRGPATVALGPRARASLTSCPVGESLSPPRGARSRREPRQATRSAA
jgi:formiminoglutamase